MSTNSGYHSVVLVKQVPNTAEVKIDPKVGLDSLIDLRRMNIGVRELTGSFKGGQHSVESYLRQTALANPQLDVVNMRAKWNVSQWQRISWLDIRIRTRHDRIPNAKLERGDDIALFAIGIVQQSDAGGSIPKT